MTMQTATKQLILTVALIAISLLFINSGVLAQQETEQPSKDIQQKDLEAVTISGTVKSLEGQMTTWMYGIHLLINASDGDRYALKSEKVNLSDYSEQKVTIKGILVHKGLDSGPPLIEVEQVILEDKVVEERLGLSKERLITVGSFLAVSVVGAALLLKLTGE